MTRMEELRLKGRRLKERRLPASARKPVVGHTAHILAAIEAGQFNITLLPDTFGGRQRFTSGRVRGFGGSRSS